MVGDEYTILGVYMTTKTKILMRHNTCGHEYEVEPYSFLRGTRCPPCSHKQGSDKNRKTTEEFAVEVFTLVGEDYAVLGEYLGATKKILMRHNTCGCVYEVKPNNFTGCGNRCPQCRTKTQEQFIIDVQNKAGEDYTVLGQYVSALDTILMRHDVCGYEWMALAGDFLCAGGRCPKCGLDSRVGQRTKTNKDYNRDVFNIYGDEYMSLGEYVTGSTKILMKHNKCGHEWLVRPSTFLYGSGCPECNRKTSTREIMVKSFLNEHHIGFIPEKQFNGMIHKKPLMIDVYIPHCNLAIELDGEHHYKSRGSSIKAVKTFKQIQLRDAAKNKYCKDNNIPLLRLKYTLTDEEIRTQIFEKIESLKSS